MNDRFPPDLFVVVLGPVLVAFIVLGLGSVIFHAEQIRGSVTALGTAIAVIVLVLDIGFFRSRRRH
jgi:hypothetical protein